MQLHLPLSSSAFFPQQCECGMHMSFRNEGKKKHQINPPPLN